MGRPYIAIGMGLAIVLPAVAAVTKDGDRPAVNPCAGDVTACEKGKETAEAVTEPMVIFLDDDGNTLARMPLSRFRKEQPDAKLPPELDDLR